MTNNSLLKGTLKTIILKLLKDNTRMYGYEITQKVKAASNGGFVLTEGALYPALHKLEGAGLLRTSTETIGGRLRKYYSLTEHGARVVTTKINEAAAFIEQLQNVLNLKPAV